jgi:hypothetical protein
VLGELHRCAAVPDRKVCPVQRLLETGLEPMLQQAVGQLLDQVVGTRTDLDVRGVEGSGVGERRGQNGERQHKNETKVPKPRVHGFIPRIKAEA